MTNNLRTFHLVILAFFLLIFINGCGYKDDPFYSDDKSTLEIQK